MKRLQRIRRSALLRDLAATTEFNLAHLLQPLFVVEGIASDEPVPGLRGVFRQSIPSLLQQVEADWQAGVRHFLLFAIPAEKRAEKLQFSFAAEAIAALKQKFGERIFLWVDNCICSYTSHGHCQLFHKDNRPDHQATLATLAEAALAYARAGADGVAPSDMMDGRVEFMRRALAEAGFDLMPIMSYSTKFSSHFYGPFRAAADSAPQFGDRKQYQIDVRNRSDALAASLRCAEEGADLLMVKPGMTAIDLLAPIHASTGLPVGAYQVSGEYAGLVLLAEKGLVNFEQALLETWQVFRRAGAQFIITYGARYGRELGFPGAPSDLVKK